MSDDSLKQAPALIGQGAQELVARAKALGVQWTLRPATVVTYSQDTTVAPTVLFDGDTVAVNAVNILGRVLPIGARVMGMLVPPAGTFIMGFLENNGGSSVVAFVGTSTSGGANSAQTVVMTAPSVTFFVGRTYRWEWTGKFNSSVANLLICRTRLGGTSGTILSQNQNFSQGIGLSEYRTGFGYFTVGGPNNVTNSVVLTTEVSGLGTVQFGAGTDAVGSITVTEVGPAVNYPGARLI